MPTKDNGGTAFPMQEPQAIHSYAIAAVQDIQDSDERERAYMAKRAEAVGGMSLRDYFAAKAMQGQMQREKDFGKTVREQGFDKFAAHIAQTSYQLADAMLAARSV